jgi:anion-transporting  ArsA/GET3 family ATPase
MSLEETVDLAKALEKLQVPMQKLLINGIVPKTGCHFCKSRRKMQDNVVVDFRKRFRSVQLFTAPQQPHEITGAKNLLKHFQSWEALREVSRKAAKAQRKSLT